jgi:hypothetical protein
MDGHLCTRIRATFNGSGADDDITLYAATDLRDLIVRVEAPLPSQARCDRPMPLSYHLTDIRLGASSGLFHRPRGYKPFEIYDPPPLCQGVFPDSADVTVGEDVRLRVVADDPGDGRMQYSWASSGGTIMGSCTEAVLSTAGMAPGIYTVTVQIGDDLGHLVECSTSVRVRERTVPGLAPN